MQERVKQNYPFTHREISKKEAIEIFQKRNEPYKIEIINDLPGETVTMYRHGNWEDLCRGPHVKSTGEVKAFKLLKVAGAYWRGKEENPQLQRIYGVAFPTQVELDEYLARLEEAAKRDHRRLGKDLDLFSSMEEMGAGLILWHPKGGRIRSAIENYWREEHAKRGYELLFTPHIARLDLWKQSGHWDFYRQNMYAPMTIDDVEYELKPMNCPFHIQIFKTRLRSYREFPLRWAELGTVYRYERSGVLHGLMRVRGFTQDDAHIFCRLDQLEQEISDVLQFCLHVLSAFGFSDYEIFLSTKPEKRVGSDEAWEAATTALEKALKKSGLPYQVDPGEGVFYGPKIDIKIKDSLKRSWQ
ncbi:MAG: threonine--tRNA ligase, partial [Deltaproteobacteria bacterium]|nr:threonine--tRNA ligase [Deltaproteobacteria bacterium]